jgi:hypothetical protein
MNPEFFTWALDGVSGQLQTPEQVEHVTETGPLMVNKPNELNQAVTFLICNAVFNERAYDRGLDASFHSLKEELMLLSMGKLLFRHR